jgi:hypothetical protein
MTSTRLHVSTLWGSSSGLYKVLKTFKYINEAWPDGISCGVTYRVIQKESAIIWEMIVCVILSKKVYMNMGPILNGYRDNITINITCIVIRRVNHLVLLMSKTVSERL